MLTCHGFPPGPFPERSPFKSEGDRGPVQVQEIGKEWRPLGPGLDAGLGQSLQVWCAHPDFSDTLKIGNTLGLPPRPALPNQPISFGLGGGRALFKELRRAITQAIDTDPNARVLLPLAKALVLNADVAGSALRQGRTELVTWIAEALHDRADPEKGSDTEGRDDAGRHQQPVVWRDRAQHVADDENAHQSEQRRFTR